ncbi:MAG TPA: sugar transferase [Terriglobales bacterium]|nr:sugar transferase [Terriglobales bacterium]
MLKRAFDFVVALLALLILALPLGVITIIIRLTSGRALFLQPRLGLHGKPFTVIKFRTMNDARDAEGNLLPDQARLTALGRFLRRTSLDELPELINVLKGEMSLVGPRPLLLQYWERYSPEQRRRTDVKPGLTGWVQINGRNALSWPQKFTLDVWYVDHQSFWLDLKIIALTAWKILRQEGISHPNHATMEEFRG